jgi:hypothetical protein
MRECGSNVMGYAWKNGIKNSDNKKEVAELLLKLQQICFCRIRRRYS